MCYHKETNFYIQAGATRAAPPGVCKAHYCVPKTLEVQENHCGLLSGGGSDAKQCRITVQDLTKSYPECCPKLICA